MTQVTPIRDLKGYLSPEQVERVIAATTNPRDALLVRIPWRTGIRVSELTGLRTQDIDFDNRAIVIKVQKMRTTTGFLDILKSSEHSCDGADPGAL